MVRKCAVLLFAVVVGSSAAAEEAYRYIVPITGNVESAGGIFYSYTRLINLSTTNPATATFDLYPADSRARCNDTPAVMKPGEFATLGGRCEGIFAAVIHSDQPLYVRSEVLSYTRERFLEGPIEEPIPVEESFIGNNEVAIIPDVPGGPGTRANLLIMNPNDVPLTVWLGGLAGHVTDIEVAPRSLLIHPVSSLVVPGDPVTGARHFKLFAVGGEFQAGVSVVRPNGGAVYRRAIPLGTVAPPAGTAAP